MLPMGVKAARSFVGSSLALGIESPFIQSPQLLGTCSVGKKLVHEDVHEFLLIPAFTLYLLGTSSESSTC